MITIAEFISITVLSAVVILAYVVLKTVIDVYVKNRK